MKREKKNENNVERTKTERMKSGADRRKQKKRRAEIRLGLLLMLLILIIGAVFSIFFFKAKKVTVVNEAIRYSNAEIEAAAGIKEDESLLLLNGDAVAARIKKALPYIGKVTVKRHIPDEVVITVEYTKATLAVETGGGYVLLNSEGKVLQTGVSRIADYTAIVYGSNVAEAVPGQTVTFEDEEFLGHLTDLVSAFEAHGFTNVTAYDLNDLTDVVVEVNFFINVRFGSLSKIKDKLDFGRATIEDVLKKNGANAPKQVVDLTYGNKAIVRSQNAIEASKEAARRAKFLESLTPEDRASYEAAENGEQTGEDGADDDYDDDYDYDYDYDDDDYDDDYDYDYDDEDEDEDW